MNEPANCVAAFGRKPVNMAAFRQNAATVLADGTARHAWRQPKRICVWFLPFSPNSTEISSSYFRLIPHTSAFRGCLSRLVKPTRQGQSRPVTASHGDLRKAEEMPSAKNAKAMKVSNLYQSFDQFPEKNSFWCFSRFPGLCTFGALNCILKA